MGVCLHRSGISYLDYSNLPAFLESCLFLLSCFRLKVLHNVLMGGHTDRTATVITVQRCSITAQACILVHLKFCETARSETTFM